MTDLIHRIKQTLIDETMLEQGDAILVAVSGGPDSVTLLHTLAQLKHEFCLTLGIAHVNHLLRGNEAIEDEEFVQKLAITLDLPFFSKRFDVKALAKESKLSIEEAGRNVRYEFFDSLAQVHAYNKIATGHTWDDNAEQVLMNLLRGSGPKGLSGIPPIRQDRYIRPLIRVAKTDLIDYLEKNRLAYQTDSSNADSIYLRNKIRNHLIPLLESDYNPEIKDSLNRLSHILRTEDDFIQTQARQAFEHCLTKKNTTSVLFSKKELATLHTALFNRVIRQAIEQVKTDLKRISLVHLESINHFCFHQPGGKSLDLPGQIRIYKSKNSIEIRKEQTPLRDLGRQEKRR